MTSRSTQHPPPSRPPLTSQQSNSVPSTPHQYAKEFRSRSRSPSPHNGLSLESHSPRSVQSEANRPLASLPKGLGRPTCKYETSAAFSRRRMQYDIGDAPLTSPREEPKKTLDPNEEKKLSGDMRELYDRLLPSEESDRRRLKFVEKLDRILRAQWPETQFTVHIFGSSGNLLCTSESDVDICIQTPMKKLETMHMLAEVLANNGMERVICIAAAKVPIVKLWDPELQLAADMNVNNTLALENTRMIKTYVQIDERVRPLAMIVKHWTKQRILNDAGIGGTLSSYAWICMILNFLQTRNPPILPALHQRPHKEYLAQDGTESGFDDAIQELRNFGADNKETIGDLLFHFFRTYAFQFEYDTSVVSVRHGKVLTRKEKSWDHTSKEGMNRLAIEEPFNTSRNLGNSADSTAFRGIHLELRKAFEHLAKDVQLGSLLEAYEWPPEEKFIFKKPVSGPKPTLTAAIAPIHPSNRAPRGGGSLRGGRHNNQSKQGSGFRRSSSGASFGRHPYPFLNSPPLAPSGPEYQNGVQATPEAVARLQEQLIHQASVNGMQLEQLKARFALQAQQIRAAEQARNASVLHAHTVAQGSSNKITQGNGSAASPKKTPFVTGNSSPSMSHSSIYPEYLYHPYETFGSPLTQSHSHDGSRTNPSSPLLGSAVPRRTQQRLSEMSGNAQGTGSLRSQSQPARGMGQHLFLPGYHPFPGVPGFGMPYSMSSTSKDPSTMSQSSGDGSVNLDNNSNNNVYRTSSLQVDQTPKEYVGYFLPGTQASTAPVPQPSAYVPTVGTLQSIPAFSDLRSRRNRPSQDMQLTMNGNRHTSRSPSPLGAHQHQRTFSIPVQSGLGLRSAPLPLPTRNRPEYIELPPAARPNRANVGPTIVNGSTALPDTPEHIFTASDEDASTAGGEGSGASLFSQNEIFSQTDALGLGGMQSQYNGTDFISKQGSAPATTSQQARRTIPSDIRSEQRVNDTQVKSPPQAFPSYFEQSIPEQTNGDGLVSPRTIQAPWTAALTNGARQAIPHLDTAKAALHQNRSNEPKTAPVVLSPVYETRTPSPTTIRRNDHFHARQSSLNGILAPINGDIVANVPVLNGAGKSGEPVPPTPFDNGDANGVGEMKNGWQTQGTGSRKKPKNRKRTKSGPYAGRSSSAGTDEVNGPSSRSPLANGDGIKAQSKPTFDVEQKGG